MDDADTVHDFVVESWKLYREVRQLFGTTSSFEEDMNMIRKCDNFLYKFNEYVQVIFTERQIIDYFGKRMDDPRQQLLDYHTGLQTIVEKHQ